MLEQLGFIGLSNACTAPFIFHMPIDRPSLKMSSHLLQHGLGGHTFPDLYFLLPIFTKTLPYPEIEQHIIACGTIGLTNHMIEFLDRQLLLDYPDRLRKIMPYHSLMLVEYQDNILDKYEKEGSRVRIIVATNCLANGIDTLAEEIIVFHQEDSFEGMVQWAGRAGRRGKPGRAIIYGAKWLSDNITRTAAETRVIQERRTKAKIDPAFVSFHSPSNNQCSRWAISHAFEEPYLKPLAGQPCCGYCDPDDNYLVQNKLHQVVIDRMGELVSDWRGKDPKTDCKYAQ